MKNKRKALHPLAIGLLMAGLLAGCGGQEAASPKQGNASGAQVAVVAEAPKPLKATQFKSVAAMMEELGDFSTDNNTFKVISEQPLHIQLSNIAVAGVPEQEIKDEAIRAALYGVYRTFIHTPADLVKVTVLPVGYNPNTQKELPRKDLQFSVQVNREQALEVAKVQLGVASLDDLVTAPGTEPALNDSWAPAMKEARSKTGKDSTPSSTSLAAALGAPV